MVPNVVAGFSPRLERLIVEILVIVGIFVKEDSVALAANRGAEVARWIRLDTEPTKTILTNSSFAKILSAGDPRIMRLALTYVV